MHVLVIEDSRRLRESIRIGLERSGYAVDAAADGESGLRYALHNPYDVVILDLMLPGLDGHAVLERLRESGRESSVLILSAKGEVQDRISGLRQGADDYLTKPFSFDEMLARIEALTRRRYDARQPEIRVGDLFIDTAARTVSRDGRVIVLSRREYALLEYLAMRKGQIVSRMDIEDHLYSERNFPSSNAVDRTVCTLRRKIQPGGGPAVLSTRRGLGYILHEPDA